MERQLLRLEFDTENVREPIVYQMGLQFGLTTNILRANIRREGGWTILELIGEGDDVSRAVEWCRDRGVSVEMVGGELLE